MSSPTPQASLSKTQRIASLLSSATEMLYGIGLGDRVVGVSHECDWPPEVAEKPRLTRSRIDSEQSSRAIDDQVHSMLSAGDALYEIDHAALIKLRPDLIVTQAQCDVCAVRLADVVDFVHETPALQTAQIVALNPTGLDDVFNDVRRIGTAAGESPAAANYAESLQGRIDRVRQKTAPLPADQRPRVACIEWIEPLMLAANWTPELIEIAGGRNQLTAAGQHSHYHDWSELVEFEPDVLIISPCGFDVDRAFTEAQVLTTKPRWKQLSAVQNRRVFVLDGNALLNRAGPRLVDTVEILAGLIHPKLFPPRADGFMASKYWRRFDG